MNASNVPTRVLAAESEAARLWTPWPSLLDSEPAAPISEPPDEINDPPFIPPGADADATDEPDEEDTGEIELAENDDYDPVEEFERAEAREQANDDLWRDGL